MWILIDEKKLNVKYTKKSRSKSYDLGVLEWKQNSLLGRLKKTNKILGFKLVNSKAMAINLVDLSERSFLLNKF